MHQIRENVPPMQHNVSKKVDNVVLGLDVLKGILPNSVEQLSIMEIRNQNNRLACEMRIERNGALTGPAIEGITLDVYFMHRRLEDASE